MEQNTNTMQNDLLSDPAKLQSALSAASSLFGGSSGAASPAPPARPAPQAGVPAAAPAPMMPPPMPPGMSGARSAGAYDPSAELMRKVMPVINTIARSGKHAVNQDRANLLQSFKPFVTNNVGSQFDHAIRLVSIARMAKDAMLHLGGGQDVPTDGTKAL